MQSAFRSWFHLILTITLWDLQGCPDNTRMSETSFSEDKGQLPLVENQGTPWEVEYTLHLCNFQKYSISPLWGTYRCVCLSNRDLHAATLTRWKCCNQWLLRKWEGMEGFRATGDLELSPAWLGSSWEQPWPPWGTEARSDFREWEGRKDALGRHLIRVHVSWTKGSGFILQKPGR